MFFSATFLQSFHFLLPCDRGINGARCSTIVRTADEMSGADYILSDLRQCTIHLRGRTGALRIQDVRDCLIYAGPVAGATYVNGELEPHMADNHCNMQHVKPKHATSVPDIMTMSITGLKGACQLASSTFNLNILYASADVHGSCLILHTHQLRIHSSTDATFLLRVQSHPIIEHCSGMR